MVPDGGRPDARGECRRVNADRYTRDHRHGQLVPSGRALSRLIAHVLPQIHRAAVQQIRAGRINLSPWVKVIAEAATPVVVPYWTRGYTETARDLLEQVRRRQRRKSLFATASPNRRGLTMGDRADLLPQVQAATLAFAQSTLDTVASEVTDAVQATREAMHASVLGREGQAAVNARLRQIFTDPARADRIGVTEAVRIHQAGAMSAAIESSICGTWTWLSNSTACDACRDLEGKTVRLGQPFFVHNGGNPAYRVVLHPPMHPFCRCVCRTNVDLSAPIPGPSETHLEEMVRRYSERPFRIKPKTTRAWPGGFMADGFYYEDQRRIPHPKDPLAGNWSGDKPWTFWGPRGPRMPKPLPADAPSRTMRGS